MGPSDDTLPNCVDKAEADNEAIMKTDYDAFNAGLYISTIEEELVIVDGVRKDASRFALADAVKETTIARYELARKNLGVTNAQVQEAIMPKVLNVEVFQAVSDISTGK